MAAVESIETQRIRAVWKLLSEHLKKGEVSVVFTFAELANTQLLSNRLALKHTLDAIQEQSNKKVFYEIACGPERIISGGYNQGDGTTASGVYLGYPSPIAVAPPEPIGYEVFVSDLNKLDEYFSAIIKRPIRLSEMSVEYDDNAPAIFIGDRRSVPPAALNEHLLCRVMFAAPIHRAVDWSEIYEAMTGNDPLEAGPAKVSSGKQILAHTRKVRDAMHSVNERLKHDLNTQDELFSWKNKSVTRNF